MSRRFKFEVPYNGDSRLIASYRDFEDKITMVYGRAEDGYPQGRKTEGEKPISLKDIFKVAKLIAGWGIKFNYILNGTSHGNREFDRTYRKEFVAFVKKLADGGVSIVTIGNLFLLEVIASEVPQVEVFASALLEVDCLVRLKEVVKLGANYVCLSKTLLKNFKALENIVNHSDVRAEFVLLVNDPCLHHCAYTHYHNEMLSISTSGGPQCISYCRMHCTKNFASDAGQIVSASFIRPEDLRAYYNMGFRTFKLCDRKQTTKWILRALGAYADEFYDGNLSDIMAPWSKQGGSYEFPRELSMKDFEDQGMVVLRDHLRFTPIIDNKKLDGYLDHWIQHKRNGCRDEDCKSCGHCARIALLAVKSDPVRRKIIVRNTEVALEFSRK